MQTIAHPRRKLRTRLEGPLSVFDLLESQTASPKSARQQSARFRKGNPLSTRKGHSPSSQWRIYLGVFIVLVSLFLWWRYGHWFTVSQLQKEHRNISAFIGRYPLWAPLLYVSATAIVVGLTLPGATVLSMAAGLFFRQPWASVYAWIGCATGAVLCFALVKTICTDCLKNKVNTQSGWFQNFEKGMKQNELMYLIYVRYLIIIPFWTVNVSAALLEARLELFVLSTFLATLPGSVLYTTAGRGMATAFEVYTEEITVLSLLKQVIFSEDIKYCLIWLAICGLMPLAIRYYQKRIEQGETHFGKRGSLRKLN